MSWTTASELKAQLKRRWERGELLRSALDPAPMFPLRLKLDVPGSRDLAERFEAVRAWIAELAAIPQLRIEWRVVNHRVLGMQRVPQSVWVDSREAALVLIGKRAEAMRFGDLVVRVQERYPALLAWLAKRPMQALALTEEWDRLLDILDWVARHPRPGVYLRQVDVPGVHSKFIEAHRAVLIEWLDLVLPPHAIRADHAGVGGFSARYGFLDKPVRIRFRTLDRRIEVVRGLHFPDVTLDAESFARLDLPARRVFVTENEINFLAFPQIEDSIVVFGAGYGWDALARAAWLHRRALYYWGDIDTHGFAILDALRSRFDHVCSFLMDQPTLMAHQMSWDEEKDQVVHDLPRLTDVERALFDELRDNRIRKGLRLEQERVAYRWVTAALDRMDSRDDPRHLH